MKAWVYLNTADDHFLGWKPEHMASMEATGELRLGPHYALDGDCVPPLENVFQFCNGADPQSDIGWYDHGFRSLSVGDAVLLMDDDYGPGQRYFVCEPSGWRELKPSPVRVLNPDTLKKVPLV